MHLVGAEGGRQLQLERCGWLRLDRSGRRMDRSGRMRAMLPCEGKKKGENPSLKHVPYSHKRVLMGRAPYKSTNKGGGCSFKRIRH